MATFVIFHASPDAALTRAASMKAKDLGLTVRSARSGALLVEGAPTKVRAAAKVMPGGDWEVAKQQAVTTMPEKKPQPQRRVRPG
jgi:hypothetical protein